MDIGRLVETMEMIAPLSLAGSWDNTGLLLEGDREVERVLLTINLTEAVAAEAIEQDVDLLVSYHPPIFSGLKRLTGLSSHGPALLALLRNRVHVYSPHTALDAALDGVSDWLLSVFEGVTNARPIIPDEAHPHLGAGRIATIETAQLGSLLPPIKQHLNIQHLRVAGDLERSIQRVAVCPGNGTSLFKELRQSDGVDLVLTGEMTHHDVLRHCELGHAVVISEHSHTERGFLSIYGERIRQAHNDVSVATSALDQDPLRTY